MAKLVFLVLAALCVSLVVSQAATNDSKGDGELKIGNVTLDRRAFMRAFESEDFKNILKSVPSRKRRDVISGVALKTALCVGKELVKDTAKGAWNKITGKKEEESLQNKVLKQIPGGTMAYRTSKCAGQVVTDIAKDVAKAQLDAAKDKVNAQIDAAKKALDNPVGTAQDVTKAQIELVKSTINQQVDLGKQIAANPIGVLQGTVKSANDRVAATKEAVMAPVNAAVTVSKLFG